MGDEHRMSEQAFTAISHETCPSLAETLLAVVAAWRPGRPRRPRRAARPDVTRAVRAPSTTAARAPARSPPSSPASSSPDATSVEGLWLDEVLATRRAHPVMIAALAAELGRRAGWKHHRLLDADGLVRGARRGDVLWLVEPTGAAAGVPTTVRRHCAHEIAYVVLTGLAQRFESERDRDRARRLRDHLALFEAPDGSRRRAARRALDAAAARPARG